MTIKIKTTALLFLFITVITTHTPAQSIELLGGNALNGTINGVLMGGATMALQNSDDLDPIRIGAGVGALYGIGVGVYDLTQVSKGEKFFISGTFNDGNNSTIIVLLDTFYGAAAGAVVATAVNLIASESFVEGLQYGSGIGAWVGFGFGIVDSFYLADRPGSFTAASMSNNRQVETGGLVSITDTDKMWQIGLLNPSVYTYQIKKPGVNSTTLKRSAAVDLVNFSFQF